ncbi:MAG: insulinase family protein [Bacteroidetes bacterium]|nr:insulinase family protein [Bacteroidota bacterium]
MQELTLYDYMLKKVFLGIGLCIALIANAQQRLATYADYKEPKWTMRRFEGDPLNVRVYTFKNGLTLIASPNNREPRIYTAIAVRTGSKNDPADHTGLAHYLEHMLFKGTNKYGTLNWEKEKPLLQQVDSLYEVYNHTAEEGARKRIYRSIDSVSALAAKWAIANEYDKMCQAMGAAGTNAFTSTDQTVYVNDIPSNMMHKWLELESERYRYPVLRLFHTELEAVYEEKNMSLDRDGSKVNERLMAELFRNHNYGKQTTIGTVEHLKNPSLTAIREYYKKYYVPNNMAIIMCGDFDPDAAADGIAEHFAWMTSTEVPEYTYTYEMLRAAPKQIEIKGPDAEWVTIGYRTPEAGSQNARIARLVDMLLSNSQAGLMDLNLVKSMKVLSAGSSVDQMNDYGVFSLTGRPRAGQSLEEVRDLMLGQMQLIREGKFEDSMLRAVILNEEISRISGFNSNQNRTYFLLDAFISKQGYQETFNELWKMSRIRKAEIQEFAMEFLNSDRVEVFKRRGQDSGVQKIVKPEIHPVELNRDKQSAFVTEWLQEETNPVQPVFCDFGKDIVQTEMGPATLYYVQNTQNRLFTLQFRIESGRFHNKLMPLAMEYLKLAGTGDISADAISRRMYSLGCSFSARSEDRRSYITLNGPEENFNTAISLLENLVKNISAEPQVFQSMIQGIEKRRTDAKLSSRSIGSMLTAYAMYGSDNPNKWVLSTEELKSIKAEEIVKIIQSLFTISHAINYYGQREISELKVTLKERHALPAKFIPTAVPKDFTPRKIVENEVYFAHYNQVQATVYWVATDEIYQPSEEGISGLFNQYFGGDMSSVVFQSIRESKALAYNTYAGYNLASRAGKPNTLIAMVGTQADKLHESAAAMNELLQKIPADTNVFELARQSLLSRLETERVEEAGLVQYYFALQEKGLKTDPRSEVYKQLPTIQLSDIMAFHQKHFANRKYAMTVTGSREKVGLKDLARYGKVKELSMEELFGY